LRTSREINDLEQASIAAGGVAKLKPFAITIVSTALVLSTCPCVNPLTKDLNYRVTATSRRGKSATMRETLMGLQHSRGAVCPEGVVFVNAIKVKTAEIHADERSLLRWRPTSLRSIFSNDEDVVASLPRKVLSHPSDRWTGKNPEITQKDRQVIAGCGLVHMVAPKEHIELM